MVVPHDSVVATQSKMPQTLPRYLLKLCAHRKYRDENFMQIIKFFFVSPASCVMLQNANIHPKIALRVERK